MSSERSLGTPWRIEPQVLAGWIAVGIVFVFAYWKRILWVADYAMAPDYQYCFFVPAFSVALLWLRRDMIVGGPPAAFSYWSIPCFAVWAAMRGLDAYMYIPVLDGYSVIPFLFGVTLALGGWKGFRWAWPALVFMMFLFPLPSFLETEWRHTLQRIATHASVFLIQTFGIPAVAQGNAIHLSEPPPLEVADVCSGLRMMMVFVTICVGAAFVMKGPLWEKIVIVVSSIPIAIVANVARITATGVQREYFSSPGLDHNFHDLAGFAMPPLALLIAWGEITLLNKLFPEERLDSPLAMGIGESQPKKPRPARVRSD
jgi:exosortase